MVELGNKKYFEVESGGTPNTNNINYWNGDINWITLADLPQDNFITLIDNTERKITESGLKNSSAKLIPVDSIIVSSRATIGRVGIAKKVLSTNQGFKNIIIKDQDFINPFYLAICMVTKKGEMDMNASGGTFKEISKTNFEKIIIPIPKYNIQKSIVNEYYQQEEIIKSNKKLIEIMENKISEVLNKI